MAVTKGTVRKLADERSFERGERYFAAGQVRRVAVDGSTVTATVDGTQTYRVRRRRRVLQALRRYFAGMAGARR
ncbi:SWIM zinc finger family protein [Lentzea jiangxiensis]|uniref:Uncharacterized protein n=1 Tax=Lentzea jiangxiensis TaxID=641025 RepID=A0A1H0FGG0_9PSEU|nr:hypothetical protein [Lentzea jiangxiensis]SDN93686.1 hypothetical protein SAMN05421507_101770 [Lentzea jiangxiensis]